MRNRLKATLIVLLIAAIWLPLSAAAQSPLLTIAPAAQSAPVGSEVAVEVLISGVSGLYGVDLTISFDPTILQVRDADGDAGNGVQVSAGELLRGCYEALNLADNTVGLVRFAGTLQRPAAPISGDGSLVRIVFVAAAPGGASVAITGALLGDTEGMSVPVEIGPAALISVGDVGWIVGRVQLQGRTNHSGVAVRAGTYSAITDATGAFRLAVPAGLYSVSTDAARYLDAVKPAVQVRIGEEVVLALVKLLGGDANDDGMVNVVDLAIIGAAFGSTAGGPRWDGRADINGDGSVNICDVTLAASNFGRVEPLPWP